VRRISAAGVGLAGVLYLVLVVAGQVGAQTEGPLVRAYIIGSAVPTGGDATAANQVLQTAELEELNTGQGSLAVLLAAIQSAVEATESAVGDATLERYISAGSTEDENEIKATAGTLIGISARNAHASTAAYLKCTNLTAANTTPGTSAIFYEMIVPPASGFVDATIYATFDTALTCYIVTGKADNDVAEVGAGDVSYNLRYK
jgi:hypothetical protein